MAKYDVHPLGSSAGLVLDVQAELLDHLNTRVVVPLIAKHAAPRPASRLNPLFTINGEPYVLVTQFLAAVQTSELQAPVANLNDSFAEITAALDFVFQGF